MVYRMEKTKDANQCALRIDLVKARRGLIWKSFLQTRGASAAVSLPGGFSPPSVGARPQPEEALAAPVNALERQEDADGRWRRFVNAALAGSYQALFARIDRIAFLAAPDFDVVARWRGDQEAPLRAAGRGMDEAALARFIQRYRVSLLRIPSLPDIASSKYRELIGWAGMHSGQAKRSTYVSQCALSGLMLAVGD